MLPDKRSVYLRAFLREVAEAQLRVIKFFSRFFISLLAFLCCISVHAETMMDEATMADLVRMANSGDARSAYLLARHYNKINDKAQYKKWLLQAAKLGDKGAILDIGYKSPYVAETKETCGSLAINVTTYCEGIDDLAALPACKTQHVRFFIGDRKVQDFTFTKRTLKENYALARSATCFKLDGSYWLDIGSGNLGSGKDCNTCERDDVFDEGGKYVGSMGQLDDFVMSNPQANKRLSQSYLWRIYRSGQVVLHFEVKTFPAIE